MLLARRGAGMSQHALAAAIGSSLAQIRRCEAGSAALPAADLVRLAVALDVPLGWLHGFGPSGSWPAAELAAVLKDPELADLVDAYRAILDDGSRRLLLATARFLATIPAAPKPPAPRPLVLVADDVPDTLMLVGAFLRSGGYDTLGADAAGRALDMLVGGATPEVLVTDYALPDMNGLELVRRASGLRPGLPVVLMTGFAADLLLAPDGQSVQVLAKPFGCAALLAAVDAAGARAGAAR